eukprot:EG_transcript_8138
MGDEFHPPGHASAPLLPRPMDPAAAASSEPAAAAASAAALPAWAVGAGQQPAKLTFPFGGTAERAGGEEEEEGSEGTEDDELRLEEGRPSRALAELHSKLLGKLARCQRDLLALNMQGRSKAKAVQYLHQMEQLLRLSLDHHYVTSIDPKEVDAKLERFLANLVSVRQWPRSPLPIPNSPPNGTCSYFEHPSEGRIKLMWTNPLPVPGVSFPMYYCDVCLKGCKASWQHITLGDQRDTSSFHPEGTCMGFDVCIACFEEYRTREQALLAQAAREAFDPEAGVGQRAVCRSQLYRVVVNIPCIVWKSGGLTVQLQAPATGEYLLCTATLDGQLPDSWVYAKVEVLEQFHGEEAPSCSICLDSVLDTTEGRIRPVRTKCGHFFHELCLRKQFRGGEGFAGCRRCPLCREADPLDLQSNPDIQVPLEFSLQTDCRGEPFIIGARYLVVCFMASDRAKPVESYSCATFHATTYLVQS